MSEGRASFAPAALAAILTLLVMFSIGAGAVIVRSPSTANRSADHDTMASGSSLTTGDRQNLELKSRLVDRQREAVDAQAEQVAAYATLMSRRPVAPSGGDVRASGRDAIEAGRREGVLAGLVLDCINAVDAYNLSAQPFSVTQLQSAGLPERYVWAVDCAAGP